eukprot:1026657-Pleurochrysis_carterae.AAC.1
MWAVIAVLNLVRGLGQTEQQHTGYQRLLSSIYEVHSKLGTENIFLCNRSSAVRGSKLYVPKMEFGYVALLQVPKAYRHCQSGTLRLLQICRGWYPLFYFVPRGLVVERDCSAEQLNETAERALQFHTYDQSLHHYLPPYAKVFVPPKDLHYLFLWNKFNIEWGVRPYNFFDVNQLTSLFDAARCFTDRIYLRRANARSLATGESAKDALLVDLKELPRLRSGLATGIIQDDIDNNDLELMNVALLVLMSGADLAVGVQGGLATLSSIVGSHTLILCVRG